MVRQHRLELGSVQMIPSHDWRGIHPYERLIKSWVVAQKLHPSISGSLRMRYWCWTRSGAERLVQRLNDRAVRRDNYDHEAMIATSFNSRYELVGNIKHHPNRLENM